MSPLDAPRIASGFTWLGLAETTLRVLLVAAVPVSAVIFLAQSL
ncbi:hypothetical protein PMI01_03535 [Caulobacter sp. AP07]|nr:hypothetical protein [Caulobacter sp. AP07]EJL28455.1 hypothetical protein PMI01_03535 [Caulobacter sp. AP07]